MDPVDLAGAVVVKTIVTTEMVLPIARKYNVDVMNTLTGFKYIGDLIDELPPKASTLSLVLKKATVTWLAQRLETKMRYSPAC